MFKIYNDLLNFINNYISINKFIELYQRFNLELKKLYENKNIIYSPSLFVYSTQKNFIYKYININASYFSIFERILRLAMFVLFFYSIFFTFNFFIFYLFIYILIIFLSLNIFNFFKLNIKEQFQKKN